MTSRKRGTTTALGGLLLVAVAVGGCNKGGDTPAVATALPTIMTNRRLRILRLSLSTSAHTRFSAAWVKEAWDRSISLTKKTPLSSSP